MTTITVLEGKKHVNVTMNLDVHVSHTEFPSTNAFEITNVGMFEARTAVET